MLEPLKIRLLGQVSIWRGQELVTDFVTRKEIALLVYLACTGKEHSREALADLLWDDRAPEQALSNLRTVLSHLKRDLGPYLITTRESVMFDWQTGCWLDVGAFQEELATIGGVWKEKTQLGRSVAEGLTRALDLYQGDFLAGFYLRAASRFEEWVALQRELLRREAGEGLSALVDYYLQAKRYAAGIEAAGRLLALDSLNEAAYRQMMTLLAFDGQRGAALAQYETCRLILNQELGVEPGSETTALYEQIQADELAPVVTAAAALENPYKGLQTFQEADAVDFFGRDDLVARLAHRLGECFFLAVIGPSGSGKSSLVRAGLIPALRRTADRGAEGWLVATMFPGQDPLAELAAALEATLPSIQAEGVQQAAPLLDQLADEGADLLYLVERRLPPESMLLLLVDQFEELFNLVEDKVVRVRFISLLLGAASPRLRVVVTLRADFYAAALRYPELARSLQGCAEIVLPLSSEGLRHAIIGPAERVGASVEPNLATALVTDAGREPGSLPLLQYALTELFERREGRTMTLSAYRAIGGLAGALVGRADELYDDLTAEEQQITRQLSLRLIVPGEGTGDTRWRVERAELLSLVKGEEKQRVLEAVIDQFARHRLLTLDRDLVSGAPTVTIAHEALIDTWDRMRDWIEVNRQDIRLHRRFAPLAVAWEQGGRDASFLLRGRQLDQFESWATATDLALTEVESAYLEASLAERNRRRAEEQARWKREAALERRGRNRLRALVAVMGLATVVALALTAFAFDQRRVARREAAVAQSLNLATNSGVLLSEHNTDLALALALEANRIKDPPPQAQWMLAQAAYAPSTRHLLVGHTDPVQAVVVTSDGRRALSASADGGLILWDLETGAVLRRFERHADVVHDVALLPGDRQALSASADGGLILWDLETAAVLHRLDGHETAVRAVAVLDGGRRALSASDDGSLILWDLETQAVSRRFSGHQAAVLSVAVAPDGRRALSGAADGGLILWDLETGEALYRMAGQADTMAAVQPAEGEELDPTRGHFDAVWGVAFLPEGTGGRTALSVSQDEYLLWWDLETGTRIKAIHVEIGLFDVAPGPYGATALLGTLGNQVLLIDLESEQILFRGYGHTGRVLSVAPTPDGRGALSGAADSILRLWDLRSGAEVRQLFYPGSVVLLTDVDISPDGRLGLTAMMNNEIALWEVASGAEICRLLGHQDMPFAGAQFLLDTQEGTGAYRVVSGSGDLFGPSEDNTVRLWQISTALDTGQVACREIGRFEGHTDRLWDVAASLDGRWVASGSHDGTLRLWDLSSGEGRILLDVSPQAVRSVAFSPDGELLAVGLAKGGSSRPDYAIRLLERATGREIRRLVGHGEVVADVAFSPDGGRLLSAGNDSALILWDVAAGTEIRRLLRHTDSVVALAFHPDGRLAVSGSTDASLILWDTVSGEALRHYTGHTKAVLGLAFSPEGDRLFSAGDEVSFETVREWRIDVSQDDLLVWIEANRYVPELSCEQREQYRVEPSCEGH